MSRTIYVTNADIDQAMHGNSRFCPIGIALHRQGYSDPWVGRRMVTLRDGTQIPLPNVACDAIAVWDGNSQHPPRRIAPFSFAI